MWSRLSDVRGAAPEDYRRLDSRLHLAIAEAAGVPSLVPLVAENRMRINTLLDQIPLLGRNIAHSDEQHEAIVIAILIVLNAQDRKDRPAPTTITETPSSQTSAPEAPPETPGAAPPVIRDHEPDRNWVSRPVDEASPSVMLHASEQILR